MPQPLAALAGEVRWRFDFLVIATPYHDLAAAGWGDFTWPRPTDPFLFGFLRQAPESMFFLGRWSGSGVFPLITDMMAATLRHLRAQRPLLAGTWSKGVRWYKTGLASEVANLGPRLRPERDYRTRPMSWLTELRSERAQETWRQEHHTLARFAARLLRQFKQGSLFPWLRGEGR
jgi:hypothetical protein